MIRTLSAPDGLAVAQVPLRSMKRVPIFNVPVVHRQTFSTVDGEDEEEVIEWADGSSLQVHRMGMGARHR